MSPKITLLMLCVILPVCLATYGRGNYNRGGNNRGGYNRGNYNRGGGYRRPYKPYRPYRPYTPWNPVRATTTPGTIIPVPGPVVPVPNTQQCQEVTDACGATPFSSLEDRIINNGDVNDQAGGTADGNVVSADVIADLTDNYDTNGDGCVTQAEWRARMAQLGFSEALSDEQFLGVRNNANGCDGADIAAFGIAVGDIVIPLDTFNDQFVASVISLCEGNQALYATNCDCAQLPDACRSLAFANSPSCAIYAQTTQGRAGCIFQP